MAVQPASSLQRATSITCWTYVSRGRSFDCGVVEKISICSSSFAVIARALLCHREHLQVRGFDGTRQPLHGNKSLSDGYWNSLICPEEIPMLDFAARSQGRTRHEQPPFATLVRGGRTKGISRRGAACPAGPIRADHLVRSPAHSRVTHRSPGPGG